MRRAKSLRSPCQSCSEVKESQSPWLLPVDLSTLQLPQRASKQNQIKQIPAETKDALFPAPAMKETPSAHAPFSQAVHRQTNIKSLALKHANEMNFCSALGKVVSPPGMKAVRRAVLCRFTTLKVIHWSFPVYLQLQTFEMEEFARITKPHQ